MYKYFKKIGNTDKISGWKSKGLTHEVIKPLDNELAPKLIYTDKRLNIKFNRNCLKQDEMKFNLGT